MGLCFEVCFLVGSYYVWIQIAVFLIDCCCGCFFCLIVFNNCYFAFLGFRVLQKLCLWPKDVIISEWMGFYLLHESMLESVLVARDRFLRAQAKLNKELALESVSSLAVRFDAIPFLFIFIFSMWFSFFLVGWPLINTFEMLCWFTFRLSFIGYSPCRMTLCSDQEPSTVQY